MSSPSHTPGVDPPADKADGAETPSVVSTAAAAHPLRTAILLVIAFLGGTLVAVQSRINGQLGIRLGDGFAAALISFGSGLLILLVAAVFWRRGRLGAGRVIASVRAGSTPWWYMVGGAAGAFFVLTQSLVVGLVGVALFTVGVVAGQTVSSLLIDRRGLGSMNATAVTWTRLLGAVIAVAAVLLAASPELRSDVPLWALIFPFLAGAGVGWQAAVNGQVRRIAESAFTATLGNFVVGAIVLLIAAIIHTAIAGWPHQLPSAPWLYLGGAIGTVFIGTQALIVRSTGVLLMGLAVLSGQLVMAVVFDLAFPVPGDSLAPLTIVGAALMLVAVVIAAIPRRTRTDPAAQPAPPPQGLP